MKRILTIVLFLLTLPLIAVNNDNDVVSQDVTLNVDIDEATIEKYFDENGQSQETTTETEVDTEFEEIFFEEGIASFYGGKFHGRKTASGEVFDTNDLTAAHKNLPFGTLVKVENISNGKYVIVRITDRGPFVKGRVIDLSTAGFTAIENTKKGITKVKIYVIKEKEVEKVNELEVNEEKNENISNISE